MSGIRDDSANNMQKRISPPLEDLFQQPHHECKEAETESTSLHTLNRPIDEGSSQSQYMRFGLGGIHFAVSLRHALEVSRIPQVTPLPNLEMWVEGISNIRGDVVAMVDLMRFFNWDRTTRPGEHMVLLQDRGVKIGFRVESLMGIISLDPSTFSLPSNPYATGDILPYLKGISATEETNLYILDVQSLLTSDKMNSFRAA